MEAGSAALARISRQPHDAIIVGDLGLLTAIRSLDVASGTPVLAVLEGEDHAQVVSALDAGADQALLKPFSLEEVLLWVRTALRRSGRILLLEGLELDMARGRIQRQGRQQMLSKRQQKMLQVLVESGGAVVAYSDLLRRIWDSPGTHAKGHLRGIIRTLRRKIEADPGTPVHILTVPRIGYRFRTHPIRPRDRR